MVIWGCDSYHCDQCEESFHDHTNLDHVPLWLVSRELSNVFFPHDQNFMIHEVCVSLTWNIASTQDLLYQSKALLSWTQWHIYTSVLYNQRQLHKLWKHLENTFQIGCILWCIPIYEGHNNLGLIWLWLVWRELSNDTYFRCVSKLMFRK